MDYLGLFFGVIFLVLCGCSDCVSVSITFYVVWKLKIRSSTRFKSWTFKEGHSKTMSRPFWLFWAVLFYHHVCRPPWPHFFHGSLDPGSSLKIDFRGNWDQFLGILEKIFTHKKQNQKKKKRKIMFLISSWKMSFFLSKKKSLSFSTRFC